MRLPKITMDIEMQDGISLYPGEYLTLWLNTLPKNAKERKAVQIELRVLSDGRPQVFFSDAVKRPFIASFKKWRPS